MSAHDDKHSASYRLPPKPIADEFAEFIGRLSDLAHTSSFWEEKPYSNRLYYGIGNGDYIARDILQAFLHAIKAAPSHALEIVPKRASFSDNNEPAAWLEVHEGSGEAIDATLIKPDGGEPGVRYEPLHHSAPSTIATNDEALDKANGRIAALEAKLEESRREFDELETRSHVAPKYATPPFSEADRIRQQGPQVMSPPSSCKNCGALQSDPCVRREGECPRSTTRQSVPADWQTGTFKAWKEQPGHEHAPWFLVTPNGCALRMGYHNDDAEDQRQAEWLAAACNAALGSTPDLTAYPNLQAILSGTVSGHHTEWPAVRAELHKLLAACVPSAIARSGETPRTDALSAGYEYAHACSYRDLCRQLERELAEANGGNT